jgi:cellulose synthase/poly-beta-1,6-N-acetylglucosamine synthase-like glycosyltransferase
LKTLSWSALDLTKNRILRKLFFAPGDAIRVLQAVCGRTPGFTGEGALLSAISRQRTRGSQHIVVTQQGIEADGVLVDQRHYPVLAFVPAPGIEIEARPEDKEQRAAFREALKRGDADIDKAHYRALGLYWLVLVGGLVSNAIMVTALFSWVHSGDWLGVFFALVWLVAGLFFFAQNLIYHLCRLRTIIVAHAFVEARGDDDLGSLWAKDQPSVLVVLPAYMENPELVKKALYSHCLQTYGNKHVVLLLGNKCGGGNAAERKNTRDNLRMVRTLRAELAYQDNRVQSALIDISSVDAEITSNRQLQRAFEDLAKVYETVSDWLVAKGTEIGRDVRYPTHDFLVTHTFLKQAQYYASRSKRCLEIAALPCTDEALEIHFETFKTFYRECSRVFGVELDVFQRHRYANLEHEPTKAGNLTAFVSLLGKRWQEEVAQDGRLNLRRADSGLLFPAPEYLAVFDTDVVVKPDYLLRKVSYLESERERKVGLIQSPYLVPEPEPTRPASASGTHTRWFLPLSIGLSTYNSAFWLGLNGVFRYEAIEKIKGSFMARTLIEDIEVSLKLVKAGYRIVTSSEPQCQTFSPPDLHAVQVQRERWASGGYKIAFDFLRDIFGGKYAGIDLAQVLLRLNYILTLNLLPLAFIAMLALQLPPYRGYYGIEMIPFLLYVATYVICLKPTAYRLGNYLDGLAIGIYVNFYYLRGCRVALRELFNRQKVRVYRATPRFKAARSYPLGLFEVLGIIFLTLFLLLRLHNQVRLGRFYDIFPLYHVISIVYGLYRFVGKRELVKNFADMIRIAARSCILGG